MITGERGVPTASGEQVVLRAPDSSWTEIVLVIAFFAAIAIATTFPLILQAHYALPAGLGVARVGS